MKGISYKWMALSCTTIGAIVSVIGGSTLIVALPDIIKELHTNMSVITWILMGYMLILTILVPSIGRISDMIGRKKLYVSGFAVFTGASLLCALSNTGMQLLVYRLVQGIGGALMIANSTAIVADAFPKKELGKALGINTMFISAGSVVGPILGGFLVSIGWRSIFYLNVPIGILGTLWAAFQLKEVNSFNERQRFDLLGTTVFTVSMLSLLMALTLGSFAGWANTSVLVLLAIGIITMVAFVKIEINTDQPMLDMRLLKTRILAFAYASNLFNGIARGAVTFLMVFYFQGIKAIDPIMAGILLTPFAASMFIVSPISGVLSDKYDSRILSSFGLLVSAVGLLGLMEINVNTSIFKLTIWMFIMGIGSGFFFSPNTNSIMGAVPANKRGIAAGVRTMFTNAGNVFSIAISMAILASSVSSEAMEGLFMGTQVGSTGIAVESFIGGLRLAFAISFGFSILAAILSYMRGPAAKWEKDTCKEPI